ncbi:MAG TPA: DUF2721 domain-containing protein [Alkalispirochaeta sp.]|nr:DUF2721 domain-containing protein [Alkalispirochaeta sp.]
MTAIRYGMEFTFSTPALLFPAISLLFISYTNRFISYADLVRRLHDRWRSDGSTALQMQIENLHRRIGLIRNMQISGALSLLLAVLCMVLLFFGQVVAAEIVFVLSLLLLSASMVFLVVEVSISIRALNLQLNDLTPPSVDHPHRTP